MFIVLADRTNIWLGDILSWFWANQILLLLFNFSREAAMPIF